MSHTLYPVISGYKKCTKCLNNQPVSYYKKTKKTKEGLHSICRECINYSERLRYLTDEKYREKIKEKGRLKARKKRENPEHRLKDIIRCRERYYKMRGDPEYIENRVIEQKKYYERVKNSQDYKDKKRDRYRTHQYRIKNLVRRSFQKKGYHKSGDTYKILGADWDTVKHHIENQFQEGMTWDNKGMWHIDHILPMFTALSQEDSIRLNHYTNLQPLWGKENLSKGSKITAHGLLKQYFPYQVIVKCEPIQ